MILKKYSIFLVLLVENKRDKHKKIINYPSRFGSSGREYQFLTNTYVHG